MFILLPFGARLGGSYPFLILTFKELVFPVQSGLSQQLEITVLNYIGALAGILLSNLGVYVTVLANVHYGVNSGVSRALPAIFLFLITSLGLLTVNLVL